MIVIIVFVIVSPICLLFHECGHAFAARIVRSSHVELTIGIGKVLWQGQLMGVNITIRRLFFMNSYTSSNKRGNPYTSIEKLLITVMGPIFSLLLAMLLFVIYSFLGMIPVVFLLYLFNVWIGVINLVPFKIGQKQSDGYTICKQLRYLRQVKN